MGLAPTTPPPRSRADPIQHVPIPWGPQSAASVTSPDLLLHHNRSKPRIQTPLTSRSLPRPPLPLSLPSLHHHRSKSQIQTFLEQNEGAGLQHVALKTDDICATLRAMRAR